MIQRLVPHLGGVDEYRQILLDLFLPDIFPQRPGAQRVIPVVLRHIFRRQQPILQIRVRTILKIHGSPSLRFLT